MRSNTTLMTKTTKERHTVIVVLDCLSPLVKQIVFVFVYIKSREKDWFCGAYAFAQL